MAKLHAKLLQRGEELLGGPDEVADYLGVSVAHVQIWKRGIFSPPSEVFLKLVDLLNDRPPVTPPDSVRGERPE